jgi:peptidoglycan/LPS O-acetylase OafA/YrhL
LVSITHDEAPNARGAIANRLVRMSARHPDHAPAAAAATPLSDAGSRRPAGSPRESYYPQLDGLRAIAVVLVVASHTFASAWLVPGFHAGYVGVRLFFVLSGFLITDILLRAKEGAEAAGVPVRSILWPFYVRRTLRIFPLAYVGLALAAAIGFWEARQHWIWYATYLGNMHISGHGRWVHGLSHYWSLAVEEQFYLLWPMIVLFAARSRWAGLSIVAILAALIARGIVFTVHEVSAIVLLVTRMDALIIGGLLAERFQDPRFARATHAAGALGAAAILLTAPWPRAPLAFTINELGWVLVCAWIVHGAARGFGGVTGKALTTRAIAAIGTLSYGIYVLHPLMPEAIAWMGRSMGVDLRLPAPGGLKFVVVMAATVVAASASWFLYERPLIGLKRYFPYVSQTAAARQPEAAREPERLPVKVGAEGGI